MCLEESLSWNAAIDMRGVQSQLCEFLAFLKSENMQESKFFMKRRNLTFHKIAVSTFILVKLFGISVEKNIRGIIAIHYCQPSRRPQLVKAISHMKLTDKYSKII